MPNKLIEVIENMTEEEYDNRPELRSSDFKRFISKPLYFYRRFFAPDDWRLPPVKQKVTPELQFGKTLHTILQHGGDWQRFVVEEPKGFEEHKFDKALLEAVGTDRLHVEPKDIVLGIDNARSKKAYRDWKKGLPEKAVIAPHDFDQGLYEKYKSFIGDTNGKEIIKAGKLNRYKEIVGTLMRDSRMRAVLEDPDGKREITFIWEHETGIKCKSRLDYLCLMPQFMVDWKSCTNVNKAHREIGTFGYDLSAAYYQIPAALYFEKRDPMYVRMQWVFLEKSGGFPIRKIGAKHWMPTAHERLNRNMKRLAEMTDSEWEKLACPPVENVPPPVNRDPTIYFENEE